MTARIGISSSLPNPFASNGFALVPDVVTPRECEDLAQRISPSHGASGGARNLLDESWCRTLGERIQSHPQISGDIPEQLRVVQCTYFEKSASRNWLVALHQDLSIPVAERVNSPYLTGWASKEGLHYVQPPVELLEQLVAVRLHLDECGLNDGPLTLVPCSHQFGRLAPERGIEMRAEVGTHICVAGAGSALLMRPLLLHSSSKSKGDSRRRVLHFLFGPRELPLGLTWACRSN